MTDLAARRHRCRETYARNVLLAAAAVLLIVISAFTVGLPTVRQAPAEDAVRMEPSRSEPVFITAPVESTAPIPHADRPSQTAAEGLPGPTYSRFSAPPPPPPPPPSNEQKPPVQPEVGRYVLR